MRTPPFTDVELLETARRCFLEHGPNVSTSTIARELGVSQAALFKRFKTKQELMLRALLIGNQATWIALVDNGPDDRPVPEQLREIVGQIDAFFTQLMPALSVLKASGCNPEDMFRMHEEPPPVVAHRTLTGWFERLHQRGRAHVPSPQDIAMMLLGSLNGRHMMRHTLGDRAPKSGAEYLDHLVETLWSGIGSQPPESSPTQE